ncbi:MAG: hypothetical protein K8R46_04965 [Pirellulales bacterium]|nr:hypothetical protein [Pirellulales bacterium]
MAVWYVLEFLLALVGVWRIFANWPLKRPALEISPSADWLWSLLLVLCLMAVHAMFWTDMRMRAVAMPVVALAAAAGLRRK